MTLRGFALIILIGFFPGSNAALAADDVEAADVSKRKTVGDVSVEVADLSRLVEVGGEQWRIRRSKSPTGSMMLLRNETGVPLIAPFAGEDGQGAAGERVPAVPAGGTVVRRCEASGADYPLAIASEQGEGVLDAQLNCGDSVVVQSPGRLVAPLEAINEAWAPPPGETVAEPLESRTSTNTHDVGGSGGGDDHGDTRSTATRVALRSTTTGSIEHGTDTDWFRFEVPARGVVVIELSGSTTVMGALFDASRNPVDRRGPTNNFFIKRNLDAGTYYVRVRSYGTWTGKYTLHLRTDVIGNTRSVDDLGSFWGNTPATIDPSNDLDWFRFEVSTWGDVVIESSGDLDTFGTLFDASGNHVEQDDDDGDRLNFRIERTLYAGVYYVRVHSFLGRAAGGYTLHLRTAGAFDRHGERYGATRVALPSTTTGTVFPPSDQDWFRFEVSTRDTVVIELEPDVLWGSSYTTDGGDRLQRERGFDGKLYFAHEDIDENNIGQVAFDGVDGVDEFVGGFRFERTFDPGTYYVAVYSEHRDEYGNYTLHLRGDADDPSNRQPKQAPNVDRIDGVDLGIPAQCGLEVEICVRDYQCEDGDEVRVSVNDAVAFEGEIFNRWQCEIVPVNEGSNSVSFLALNGTGFKEACNDGDVNTGELRITARGGDAETQRRRHSGGAGSEANLEITVGPRSNASCSLGTDDDTDGGGGDDHGNSLATATRVTLPSITTGTIDPGNDTDWFRFEVSASGAVVMESSGDLDILGTLFDARGRSIVQNDDGSGYPNFRIVWTLDPGTYYVRVDSYGAAPGTYALHLRTGDGDVAGVDVHGNTRATATRISLPSTTAGVIDSVEDEDYFRFEVAASSTVVMESVGGGNGTLVTLFDAAGNLIEMTLGYKFRMERTLDPGTYYVRVQTSSSFGSSTTGYTLHLRTASGGDDGGDGGDDHGNVRQDATRVSLPSTTAGTIDRVVHGDEDYFRFEVAASSTVVMESGGNLDVVGTLFNDGGRIIVQNDDGSGFPNFRIERTLDPGTYFFRVHSYQRSTYGNYALHLRTGADGGDGGGAAGDDHGNSLATATRVTLPSTTAGTIDPGEDEDYFLFEVAASSTVMMESVGGLDVAGTLFDAGGNRIALDDDGGFYYNFRMERTLDPGAYYVRVHSHGAQPGAYALHLRAEADGGDGGGAAGDDHGNSLATATRVALPSITTGTIDPGNDTDWFRFEVSAVGAVVMESGGGTGTGDNRNVVDVVGTLFDAGGNVIALDDDGGAGHNFRIERTLDPGTYYYVRVHSNNGAALGAYALHLRTGADGGDGGGAARDAHGNSRATATRISLPSTTAGAIDPGEDEDYFRFEVAASSAVVMESVGGLDVVGTLFDAGGNRIARNSHGAGYPNFRIERTLDPGIYYVRVHSDGAAPGAYALHLRAAGDAHGNSLATATRVTLPSITMGVIDPGEDEDYFRFEVAASSAVVMESVGGLDVVGTLFDAGGNRIARNSYGAGYLNFRMERTLDPGAYYVRVHSNGAAPGAYALHLRTGADGGDGGGTTGDDHGNSRATATRISLPSTTAGTIDPGEDEDYFRFEVAASSAVVMESGGGLDVVGTLFDAEGNRIALDDDGGVWFNFRMERTLDPGTYYVRVHSTSAWTGAYALHLRAAGDAHGNSLANATRVTLPSITMGAIDPGEDEDYFRFEVAASSTVVMESVGGPYVVGTLFDAGGNRIAPDDDEGYGFNFRMERTLDPGTYYVRVHSYRAAPGAYALHLRVRAAGDDHGNSLANATWVTLPSITAGTIDPVEDEDYFRFEVAASSIVVMGSGGDGSDVVGTLFDARGKRIALDDNGGAGSNFRIERTLDAGAYYVRVHSIWDGGAYALYLRTGVDGGDGGDWGGTTGDDHGNTRATATRISLPSTTAGTIDPGEDEDYFRFEVAASSAVVMESGGDLDVVGTLFDAEGNRIARNAHGAGYPNFRIERTLDPGIYYVRVHSNGAAPGAYALHLRTGADGGDGGGAAGDDHGNAFSTATRISLPSTTAGTIDPGNDTDHFRFVVSARGVVVMESTGGLDTVGTLFNVRGGRIVQDDDGAGYPNFRIERTLDAGTYYVRVHSYGAATGGYALHLRGGGTGGGDGLRISTPTGSSVEPFQQVSLAVEGGTEGADYDILVDLSGTGGFEAEDTIEVAPVRAAENQLLMAAPLPEALAKNNAARLFAVRVRERGSETMSTPLTLNLGETNVPPGLAGHPTVILDVVLKAAHESLDDPLLTVEAGAIEPGRSVRTARALGLSTAYSDALAEALLRSLFGISLVESGAATSAHRRAMASAGRGAAVRCEVLLPDALCDAYRRLTNCVGDAIDGFGSGIVSGESLDQCARSGAAVVEAWDNYGENIRTAGNFLGRAAPRLARNLGVGKPAQQLHDLNATVRQVVGATKTLRTITERAEDLRDAYEAMRDATQALTEGNAELVTEAAREIAADGVDDAERDAYFALVEEADRHYSDSAAIEELEDVYTGEADVVETLGRPAEGGGGTSGGAMCGSNYEEFPVDDKTSTCVWNSLVEWNCYAGSRHVSHPDSGGANACLYYSLDFFQPDGTCRENYAKVTFQGRQACRWAELGADKVAWYTLEKEHGVESPRHGVNTMVPAISEICEEMKASMEEGECSQGVDMSCPTSISERRRLLPTALRQARPSARSRAPTEQVQHVEPHRPFVSNKEVLHR